MADFAGGKIQAFVGPQELGTQDNLEQEIIRFIQGAQHSLDIAVQELDSEPIAQAILDARWRGISVRMFLEQDYLARDRLPSATPQEDETPEEAILRAQWTEYRRPKDSKTNRDILAALLRSSVDVKADYNPEIFHQKFIIRDFRESRKKSTSAVLSGSTNFTFTGTHKNLNHIIIFHDHRVCQSYEIEFKQIREGIFGIHQERTRRQSKTVNIEGVPVRILFAPDDSPEMEIIKQMLKCSQRLDFAIFTFSGSSGIDDAMIMLRSANRRVRGVLDPGQGAMWWAATDWLHNEGIELFFPERVPGFGKLHHKLMVIDDSIVVAGSMNYTAPANEFNDENIFVLGNPFDLSNNEGGPVDHAACAEITAFFRAEIDRIIQNSQPFQPS